MWVEAIEGVVIVMLVIALAYLYVYYKNMPEPTTAITPACPTCPTITSAVAKIKANGSTIAQLAPATLPPLISGVTNGQYIKDANTGGVYYVQNGMLSFVRSNAITKLDDYKSSAATSYPTDLIMKMAFGPPILE